MYKTVNRKKIKNDFSWVFTEKLVLFSYFSHESK